MRGSNYDDNYRATQVISLQPTLTNDATIRIAFPVVASNEDARFWNRKARRAAEAKARRP
jgi:hypothetical protein